MNYYICKPGDTAPQGPLSITAIRTMLANGTITREYYYCAEGGAQWQPVGDLIYNKAPAPLPVIAKPSNHLVWSILSTACCCLPLGIYAIIKSVSVDRLWEQGKYEDAAKAAATAKNCNIISLIIALIEAPLTFLMGII